jgi:STE24 endopeptidase
LTPEELEAVLAHEIGHYRRRHIPKLMLVSVIGVLAGFAVLGWLVKQNWLYAGFGFSEAEPAIALLLFGLLSGAVTFWLGPLLNAASRRFEYQADAFAAETVSSAAPLIAALRKMYEKNLGNLTPHPLYSGFHYSHPTLAEREAALRAIDPRPAGAAAA